MTQADSAAGAKKVFQKVAGLWWPAADEHGLREAADAWAELADEIDDVAAAAHSAALSVIANNEGPAIERFDGFWRRYVDNGKGYLPDTAEACRRMAAALNQYADAVAEAKRRVEELIVLAGATIVAGAGLAVATFGLSEAAAAATSAALAAAARGIGMALSRAIADIAGTALVGVAFGAIESMAVDAVVAQPIKVAFGDQKSIDVGEVLQWAAGGAVAGGLTGVVTGVSRGAGQLSADLAATDPRLARTVAQLPRALESRVGRVLTEGGANAVSNLFIDGPPANADVAAGALGGALTRRGHGVPGGAGRVTARPVSPPPDR